MFAYHVPSGIGNRRLNWPHPSEPKGSPYKTYINTVDILKQTRGIAKRKVYGSILDEDEFAYGVSVPKSQPENVESAQMSEWAKPRCCCSINCKSSRNHRFKINSKEPEATTCFCCSQKGHVKPNCFQMKREEEARANQGTSSTFKSFECGEERQKISMPQA
jgi:hypothetical protein